MNKKVKILSIVVFMILAGGIVFFIVKNMGNTKDRLLYEEQNRYNFNENSTSIESDKVKELRKNSEKDLEKYKKKYQNKKKVFQFQLY